MSDQPSEAALLQAAALEAAKQVARETQEQAAQNAAANQAHASTLSFGKVLNKPQTYDGKDRNACATFLAQVRLYIFGNSALFPNEQTKVLFVSTYLRGKAFSWVEPKLLLGEDKVPMLNNFTLFCTEMVRALGDPDRAKQMAKKLNALKQTGSCASYRTEFENISQYLEWDDHALKSRFYEGLKSDVKDALSYVMEEPDGLSAFQDLCVKLDNRIYERKSESRKETKQHNGRGNTSNPEPRATTQTTSTTETRQTSDGSAMDLDGTRTGPFKPLTPAEKQRRRDNNLCLYCGEEGHRADSCSKKRKSAKLQATLEGPAESDSSDSEN